jgi:hypothetical protein
LKAGHIGGASPAVFHGACARASVAFVKVAVVTLFEPREYAVSALSGAAGGSGDRAGPPGFKLTGSRTTVSVFNISVVACLSGTDPSIAAHNGALASVAWSWADEVWFDRFAIARTSVTIFGVSVVTALLASDDAVSALLGDAIAILQTYPAGLDLTRS